VKTNSEENIMKNKIQEGKLLYLAVGAAIVSGDPVMVGAIAGVAQISYDAAGKAVIDTEGVFDLSVKGENDDGNVGVAIGDRLYYDGTTTLSKKVSGKFFGTALEVVTTGTTATINVLVTKSSLAQGPYSVFAAGLHTVAASPEPSTTTTISVTGILATDLVFVQQAVDSAASPLNRIVTAIPQVSPAAIIVTTEGAPTAADTFQYMVLRKTT
jgi:predicted RecA/RadA family phage recombinase